MRVSSLLGLSVGWLITSLGIAFDVGADDLIFFPSLALGLPAVFGLVMGLRAFRKARPPEPVSMARLIGFGVLGVVLMTLASLGLIAAFYWGQPVPN